MIRKYYCIYFLVENRAPFSSAPKPHVVLIRHWKMENVETWKNFQLADARKIDPEFGTSCDGAAKCRTGK